mgnify:CR=1 FL=1
MNKNLSLIIAFTLMCFSFSATAIEAFGTNPIEKWSLYTDNETNTCFVDFESIAVKLDEVVIESAKGEVIFSEDVTDFPVDAIYEIDLSRFENGEYTINLHYYTGVLSKVVRVKK